MAEKIRRDRLSRRRASVGYWFILPFFIGFVCIFLPAVGTSLYYSFCQVGLINGEFVVNPIGFKNFSDLFIVDTQYRVVLLDAARGVFIDSLIVLIFSFFIANVLNQKFRGRTAFRAVFFLPVILATGLIAEITTQNAAVMLPYASNTGKEIVSSFSNQNASIFDLQALLSSANVGVDFVTVIVSAVNNITEIVNASGVQILVFLAGLQSIPMSVFEAARVEGATSWETFWKITFPMMGPMLMVNAVYTIVDTFVQPSYGMLGLIQDTAFKNRLDRMGYAAAMSWVYFLLIIVVLAAVALVGRKTVKYTD